MKGVLVLTGRTLSKKIQKRFSRVQILGLRCSYPRHPNWIVLFF